MVGKKQFGGKILGLLSLVRPSHSLLVFITIVLFTGLWWPAIAPALACALAFVDNDIQDVKADVLNGRPRPLAKARIGMSEALALRGTLLVLTLIFSLVDMRALVVTVPFMILSFLYNRYLKHWPLMGNMFVGLTMAAPFWYSYLFVANPHYIYMGILVFLLGVGREIVKDCEDVEGDMAVGGTTLPLIMGEKWANIVGRALMVVASLLFSYMFHWSGLLMIPVALVPDYRWFRRLSLIFMFLILLVFFFQYVA